MKYIPVLDLFLTVILNIFLLVVTSHCLSILTIPIVLSMLRSAPELLPHLEVFQGLEDQFWKIKFAKAPLYLPEGTFVGLFIYLQFIYLSIYQSIYPSI